MTIRTGVIGTGYLGRLHARVLSEIPDVEMVGFVEPNDSIAAEVESSLKLKRYDTIAQLASAVDCAVVATTTTTHFEVARELLAAGVDVMVEKPITATADEARRLIELADQRGRIIQVGHVERYNPAIMAVAEIVRGARYIEAERLGVFVPRSLDVDVLLDLMIHDLNLVLSLQRQKVVEIRAVGVPVLTDKVDMTNVRLELENGAVANLTASRVSQDRIRKQRFFCGDCYISVDTKEQEVKGVRLVEENGVSAVRPFELAVEKKEPLRAENDAFLQCVRDRTRPIVSGEDGLEAVELASRVREAIDAGVREIQSMTDISIGIIGGSGVYAMEGLTILHERAVETPFGAPSDPYVIGEIDGIGVAFLARHGRGHRYTPSEVNYRANVYGFKLLGVQTILSASAVGSMKEEYAPTDIVFPHQFIDRTRHRPDTFFGNGLVGHVAFADPICAGLSFLMGTAARAAGAKVHMGGTYVCMEGPQFSTRAESNLYRSWGADVIGMTNLTEAKLAREAEICYATMALITDYDCWHPDHDDVDITQILGYLRANAVMAQTILRNSIQPAATRGRDCACASALQYAILTDPAAIPPQVKNDLAPLIGKYIS